MRKNLNYRFFFSFELLSNVISSRWNTKGIYRFGWRWRGRPKAWENVIHRFKRQQCVSPWQITIISPTCVIFTIRNLPFHGCAACYETKLAEEKGISEEARLPSLFHHARLCINFPSRWNNLTSLRNRSRYFCQFLSQIIVNFSSSS